MKPYFTKWIPVEGEIKDGDWYKTEIPEMLYQKVPYRSLSTYRGKNTKVKLFLCSRDIKVGDKYFLEGDEPYEFTRKEDMGDFQFEYAYKVIGEVSPQALTFVKEGQEFGEGDVKKGYQHTNKSEVPENQQWYYRIKCPCCGDFK